MAALEPCIFRGKRAPKSENDNTSEDSDVDNRLEKIHFADDIACENSRPSSRETPLARAGSEEGRLFPQATDGRSVAGFFLVLTNFDLYRMTSYQHGQLNFQNGSLQSVSRDDFRIAGAVRG